jgi:similar to spore coat protein
VENDYLDPRNAEGMPKLADASLALDFLLRTKNGVRNCAAAIGETATPDARAILVRQLDEGLAMHQEIVELMTKHGWIDTYQPVEQWRMDMASADTVVKIANMELFPNDTDRQGLFATPNK